MKYGCNVNFQQNEIQNVVLQNLASAPSSPKEGQKYYNTTTKLSLTWNGTSWRPDDAAGLTDGSIKLTALEINPLARANHTGTQTASTISDLMTTVTSYRHDQFNPPNVAVSWGSQRLINLSDPTSAQDAATKNYVDGAVQNAAAGIDSKPSVRVISTSNITLSGLQIIDNVSLIATDRVLVTAQTTASQNGVYVVASGSWSRATEADQTGEITPGAFWFIEEGTAYGKTQWRCNNTGSVSVGTTAITIVQFGAANLYTADGTTLQLTGNQFAARLGQGLTSAGGSIAVDISVISRKFSATITGDNTTTSFTVTHSLGTKDVTWSLRDSSDSFFIADVQATTNTVVIGITPALTTGTTVRVIVIG